MISENEMDPLMGDKEAQGEAPEVGYFERNMARVIEQAKLVRSFDPVMAWVDAFNIGIDVWTACHAHEAELDNRQQMMRWQASVSSRHMKSMACDRPLRRPDLTGHLKSAVHQAELQGQIQSQMEGMAEGGVPPKVKSDQPEISIEKLTRVLIESNFKPADIDQLAKEFREGYEAYEKQREEHDKARKAHDGVTLNRMTKSVPDL